LQLEVAPILLTPCRAVTPCRDDRLASFVLAPLARRTAAAGTPAVALFIWYPHTHAVFINFIYLLLAQALAWLSLRTVARHLRAHFLPSYFTF